MLLKDKVAIITGAGLDRGFGKTTAMEFVKEGAKVCISDICDTYPDRAMATGQMNDLQKAEGDLKALGGDVLAVKCDVRKADEVDAMVKATMDKWGQIDILMNNAGVVRTIPVLETSEEIWDMHQDVMGRGTFLCTKAAAAEMIKRGKGGVIINMSSAAGKTGWPLLGAYTFGKFGIVGFTFVCGVEFGPHKIRVNAICPGPNATTIGDAFIQGYADANGVTWQEMADSFTKTYVPIGEWTTPYQIARLAVYLASDDAKTVTCQAINISGGQEQH
jgi:NAD(P)-dependent dehydrogenase (short-subunit alcohol dehydrogenase family)